MLLPDASQLTFKEGKLKSTLSSPIDTPETARALEIVADALQWQSSNGLFKGLPPIGRNRFALESKACDLTKTRRLDTQNMTIDNHSRIGCKNQFVADGCRASRGRNRAKSELFAFGLLKLGKRNRSRVYY